MWVVQPVPLIAHAAHSQPEPVMDLSTCRRMLRLVSLSTLAGIFALPLHGQAPEAAALIAGIDSLANWTLAAERAPGITLAVLHGKDTIVIRGYGLADVENQVPVSDQSVFRIGSVTKQFTAAAIMKLV